MQKRTGIVVLALAAVVSTSCMAQPKYRVAMLSYGHETCTFCPGGDVTIEDWTRSRGLLRGDELIQAMDGFTRQAREYGDIELIGLSSPAGVFGGSSRSWNSEESFEYFTGIMLDELLAAMPVDGVFLGLHGAMAVRNIPRPEAELARRIRLIVGPDVPIVARFDLHGNEDEEFLRWADGSFVTKRYPHYDWELQEERAARYMRGIMTGDWIATTATRKPPVLTGTVLQWTGQSPAMEIMERARRWEAREKAFVSVFFGFPWSDVPDIGATVQVMTNADQDLANLIADDMSEYIWRVREEFAGGSFPSPGAAVSETREAILKGDVPVLLGDYSDRPGDATWILRELIDQDIDRVLYAGLRDEIVLEKLLDSGARVGDVFDMKVGGRTGPQAGDPVRIKGTLRYFDEYGRYDKVALVEFGSGSMLMIVPTYVQVTSPDQLRFGPLDPDDYDVFVVKSRVHFRRGFDETGYAKTIIVVDAPGNWFGTIRLDALEYQFGPIDRMYPFGDPVDIPGIQKN